MPWKNFPLLFLFIGLLSCDTEPQVAVTGNYDARWENVSTPMTPSASQLSALAALQVGNPDVAADFDPKTGVARSLYNHVGYLTEPSPQAAFDVARDFVNDHLELLGLTREDVDNFEITDIVPSRISGAKHYYLRQRHQGIAVYGAQLQINVNREGRILSLHNAFSPNLAAAVPVALPSLAAEKAVEIAAQHLGLTFRAAPKVLAKSNAQPQQTSLAAAGISTKPIEAELMWLPVASGQVALVWKFEIWAPTGHTFDLMVDAQTEKVWTRFDRELEAHHRVFAQPIESPNHTLQSPSADARTLIQDPVEPQASPWGWHMLAGTNSRQLLGNNAQLSTDIPENTPAIPACLWLAGSETDLVCDFPLDLAKTPEAYTDAAANNAFYWVNLVHDVQYQYGFDESSGSFQMENYGRGGREGDPLLVYFDRNRSMGNSLGKISVTPDGDAGTTMVLSFATNQATGEQRSTALDAGIVVHEYGHGVSERLVGGPSSVYECLNNLQTPSEGISDWLALVYTARASDRPEDARGIASYLKFQAANGRGVRRQPYSLDSSVNSRTYYDVVTSQGVHAVGEIWAQATWEMYWALVKRHGFSTDLRNASGGSGNQRALLYVTEGLKNTPCRPSFIDMRQAIIDAATDHYDGEDVCLMWEAFAAFGLGTDAKSGYIDERARKYDGQFPQNGFFIPSLCKGKAPVAIPPLPSVVTAKLGQTWRLVVGMWDPNGGDASALRYSIGGTIFQPRSPTTITELSRPLPNLRALEITWNVPFEFPMPGTLQFAVSNSLNQSTTLHLQIDKAHCDPNDNGCFPNPFDSNAPPALTLPQREYSVHKNNTLIFTVESRDPDGDTVQLTAYNLPQTAEFKQVAVGPDHTQGEFKWKPAGIEVTPGRYRLLIVANDPDFAWDAEEVFVTVRE